jgi:TonB family protein
MRNIGRRLLSSVCALALAANGVAGALAQDKKQEKSAQGQGQEQKVERGFVFQSEGHTVTFQTSAGQDATPGVRVPGPSVNFNGPEGVGAVWVAGSQSGGDSVFQFFSQEMSFDNRLVKGAPFSADIVSETIQTLLDGNRIVQRSEGRIYRDSQGRTRNERTFQMGGSGEQRQTISIFDPVANVNYMLDPETRIARKTPFFFAQMGQTVTGVAGTPMAGGIQGLVPRVNPDQSIEPKQITVSGGVLQGSAIRKVQPPYPPVAKAAKVSGPVQVQILVNEAGEVIEAKAINGHPLLRDGAIQAARQWQFKPTEISSKAVKVQGILTFNFTLQGEAPTPIPPLANARSITKFTTNTEQLGKQAIEGVECEGTREVTTIPAGAIGNERPIETVRERWFSPELNMVIMTKQNDPRFGESTYRVTNISRAEPDAALFQVPSDYTVKEGGFSFSTSGAGAEMKLREQIEIKARKPDNQ